MPRSKQFDANLPIWIHTISRCVRRAFLCGDAVNHRRQWIEDRLKLLTTTACCEVAAFAVMSNHLHVVMRMRPDLVTALSDEQVASAWLHLWPRQRDSAGNGLAPTAEDITVALRQPHRLAQWRQRLGDLGWTMKALKECIARKANKEDGCSGAFWEGRYKSVPLLDHQALVACMAYVDLNPIRSCMHKTPEQSCHTGAYERIRIRQVVHKAARLRRSGQADAAQKLLERYELSSQNTAIDPDQSWLTPLSLCAIDVSEPLSLDEYLTLIDETGRLVHAGKRGSLAPNLAPILQRLAIDIDAWCACMTGFRQFLGSAVGHLRHLSAEASRRGLRWLQNRCALFG